LIEVATAKVDFELEFAKSKPNRLKPVLLGAKPDHSLVWTNVEIGSLTQIPETKLHFHTCFASKFQRIELGTPCAEPEMLDRILIFRQLAIDYWWLANSNQATFAVIERLTTIGDRTLREHDRLLWACGVYLQMYFSSCRAGLEWLSCVPALPVGWRLTLPWVPRELPSPRQPWAFRDSKHRLSMLRLPWRCPLLPANQRRA